MNFTNLLKTVSHHGKVLLRGLGRTVYGAIITGLIALAVYGFVLIKSEEGYAAVFDFVAAIAILVIALCNVYLLGNKRKGGKK